jgi:hypothetical protein
MRKSGRQQPMTSTTETTLKWKKVLLARLPSCTRGPRTLGSALPATRSTEASSHQSMVDGGAKIHHGGWRRQAQAAQVRVKGPVGLGVSLGGGNWEAVGYNAG